MLVAAGVVFEVVAASCSSPQTVEINADKRAGTFRKWVIIGIATAILFLGLAAIIDPAHRVEIIAGGGLAIVLMWAYYEYAARSGLSSSLPGTED